MWMCRPVVSKIAFGACAIGVVLAAPKEARAEAANLKECATQYQAAKADNKLAGQSWQDFFADCQKRLSAPAPKAEAPESPAPAAKAEEAKAEEPKAAASPPPAESHPAPAGEKEDVAAREKKCHEQWNAEAPTLKKKYPKLTWRRFLRQCSAHLSALVK